MKVLKDLRKVKKTRRILEVIEVIIGTFMAGLAINVFFLPAGISTGGASGVAIILNYLFKYPVGIVILVLNIPLFIIAMLKLGNKFTINAIIGTVLLSVFAQATESVNNVPWVNIEGDQFICSIFGGILMGSGLSLVFRGGSSTGGSDLFAQIVYKYRPMFNLSQIMLIIDFLVVVATAIVFKSINSGLYSLVAIFVSKKTIDIIFEGVNYTKVINIITQKEDEISSRIISEVERGATIIKCIGKYTKKEYSKIECVATVTQVYRIKKIVREEDTEAFIYIGSASEVLGYGFKEK